MLGQGRSGVAPDVVLLRESTGTKAAPVSSPASRQQRGNSQAASASRGREGGSQRTLSMVSVMLVTRPPLLTGPPALCKLEPTPPANTSVLPDGCESLSEIPSCSTPKVSTYSSRNMQPWSAVKTVRLIPIQSRGQCSADSDWAGKPYGARCRRSVRAPWAEPTLRAVRRQREPPLRLCSAQGLFRCV